MSTTIIDDMNPLHGLEELINKTRSDYYQEQRIKIFIDKLPPREWYIEHELQKLFAKSGMKLLYVNLDIIYRKYSLIAEFHIVLDK